MDDCWPWHGYIDPTGYGVVSVDGKPRRAHRVVYEKLVGPIPEGLVIDHLCRVRHCVNPKHLEAVTQKENMQRALPHRKERLAPTPNAAFVSAGGIIRMFGVSRQRVSQLTARPDFPEPFDVLQTGRVWLREDVEKWARERGRTIHDD